MPSSRGSFASIKDVKPGGTMALTRTYWQPCETALLQKYATSLTAKDIGRLLGRTEDAVLGKARNMQIRMQKRGDTHPSRKYSSEDVELARQLHAAGVPPREIAEKLGIKVISLGNFIY
jgi:hypothetical protein